MQNLLGLRLIREVDVNAKDPATTRVLLDRWKFAARTLFSSGRIVCMPGDGAGKTATLLALEQVDRLGVVPCGGRTLHFLDRSPTRALAAGLSVLKDVVEAAVERIDADFRPDDLYMAFGVFHLASWSTLLQILPGSIEAATTGAAFRMRRDWRHIWDAFGSSRRIVDGWSLAVLIAARQRDDLTRMRLQRKNIDADSHLGPLDNRIAWHAALSEIDRKMHWFSKICRVYLSVLDGTLAVERDMGSSRVPSSSTKEVAEAAEATRAIKFFVWWSSAVRTDRALRKMWFTGPVSSCV